MSREPSQFRTARELLAHYDPPGLRFGLLPSRGVQEAAARTGEIEDASRERERARWRWVFSRGTKGGAR